MTYRLSQKLPSHFPPFQNSTCTCCTPPPAGRGGVGRQDVCAFDESYQSVAFPDSSSAQDHEVCPFCAQDLNSSPLITHYQAYFSAAYRDLRQSIAGEIQELNTAHSGEIQAAFERAIRVAGQTQQFWAKFTDVPEVALDTAAIALAWKKAFEAVSNALLAKQASPLEQLQPDAELREKVAAYHALCDQVVALSEALVATRPQIDLVKERAAAADVAALESDLNKLKAIKARYSPAIVPLCDDYIQEKERKAATEAITVSGLTMTTA